MEKSGFFPDINGDRLYTDEFLAEWVSSFVENGVYNLDLAVTAGENMQILVQPGRAWINGRYYHNTEALPVAIDIADGVLNRYTSIFLRSDKNERNISVVAVNSAYSANPAKPGVTRNSEVYDLKLADIYVKAGTITVLQSNITDTRTNSEVCGILTGTVKQLDFSSISAQFNDYFSQYREQTEADFDAWFESIQGLLGSDPAGQLAMDIQAILESKGQPGGIAALDSDGKLAQMPTAADVGAQSQTAARSTMVKADETGKIVAAVNGTDYNTSVTYTATPRGEFKAGNLSIRKEDKRVFVSGYVEANGASKFATNGIAVCTFPDAIWPTEWTYIPGGAYDFSGNIYPAYATLSSTSGNLKVFTSASAIIATFNSSYYTQ